MIFGILIKFGIEIGDPEKMCRKKIVEQNPNTFGPKCFLDQKFSIFVRKKIVEKINVKIKILIFSLIFSTKKKFGQKSKNVGPKNISDQKCSDFFDDFFSTKFFRITYFDPKFSQDSKNHT